MTDQLLRSVPSPPKPLKPLQSVIVSGGSTVGADDIVKRHAVTHGWIELVLMGVGQTRQMARLRGTGGVSQEGTDAPAAGIFRRQFVPNRAS